MNTMMTTLVAATTPPASTPASPAPGGEADGAAFCDCLEDACAAPSPAPAAKAKPAAAAQGKAKEKVSPAADAAATPGAAPASASAAPADDAVLATASPREDKDAPATPIDLAALLPGWTRPGGAHAAASSETEDGTTALPGDAPPGTATRVLATAPRDAATARAGDAAAPIAAPPQAAAPSRAEAAALHTDTAHKPTATETAARSAVDPGTNPVALPPALPPPAHAQAATSGPAPSAALAPPPQHPDFAPALATQVRWWAEAGVQQAQLTLNPAEMGPVSVRIVVTDTREARIDFSADLAATRQAIEGSLPVLAAALDESGLKLTGGGVHDGASQRQGAWEHARAQSSRQLTGLPEEGVNERTPARAGVAARGIVDLVA